MMREKILTKTSYDFTVSAIQGAMAIARGELTPMNPNEEPRQHIYLRNNIFYSIAIDASNIFEDAGGDEASRVCASKDINAINFLNRIDAKGVSHLLTTVVDFAGKRIVAQTPVPGLFSETPADEEELAEEGAESEAAPSKLQTTVVYGKSDDANGSYLSADPDFVKKFRKIGQAFHIKEHNVWNEDGSNVVKVVTSMDTKGMKGTDERDYIIELYRTTPLDIEFIEKNFDLSKEDSYPHKEASIRNEAVEEWYRRQATVLLKAETDKLEKEKAEKKAKGEKIDEEERPTITIDDSEITLNPDCFSLPPAPTPELAKELEADQKKAREVSKLVTGVLIPEFVSELKDHEIFRPLDGRHLASMLHSQGINMRYLGALASQVLDVKAEYLAELEAKKSEISKENVKYDEMRAKQREEAIARVKATREAAEKGEPLPDYTEEDKKLEEEMNELHKSTNLSLVPVVQNLECLYDVAVQEMIARATKHFIRYHISHLPLEVAPYVISHVHNALLGSHANKFPTEHQLDPFLKEAYGHLDLLDR
ncbi:unnamed protein product [Ambrosiozyma monospora]|uniref:Unnamed protein product n=1 Tax=Ambrosiozyma monospora TaxID=43982 RepID=A0ACB5TB75_AMBMO|nr:unnamed protein product [Ambrosiozyma monospora]